MKSKFLKFFFPLLLSVLMIAPAHAEKDPKDNNENNTLSKIQGTPARSFLNINNISTVFKNDGISDIDVAEANSGFVFPKGSGKAAVFTSGFLWGAKVAGDDQPRVGGTAYRTGLQGGKITNSGVPLAQLTSESPEADHVRIYRVRRDVFPGGPVVNLETESSEEFISEAAVRTQYELDWTNWPATSGAPYEDTDANGVYDPAVDIPGVPGADQTIWFVANDLNPSRTTNLYGAQPLGIEMQATVWAYAQTGALGNMLFRKYKIINKTDAPFDSMFVSMWSDVDLGNSTDDFAGCDTVLSLGYCYNANANDATYNPLPPPAVGFDFFQGPVVDGEPSDSAIFDGKVIYGKQNLPMTSFYYFARGDASVTDPTQGSIEGSTQFYRFFQGQIGLTGNFFVDPNTLETTTYALSGDPVARTGWIDGQLLPSGDRRIGMASGPFTMAAGDTQEVVVAEIAAGAIPGVDRLSAIGLLKFYDQQAQLAYDNFFDLPRAPTPPDVKVVELDQEILLDWGHNRTRVNTTESEAAKGYLFEGYNVYQLPSASASITQGTRIATFDINNGIGKIIGPEFDLSSGTVLPKVQQFGNDTGIKRFLSIKRDELKGGTPLINGIRYYYAITAYSYNPSPDAVPNNLENPLQIITVIPHSKNPGVDYTDSGLLDEEVIIHNGTADATVEVTVVDPTQLTGHQYEVFFNQQMYFRDVDGVWKESNPPTINKPGDVSPSSLQAVGLYGPEPGTAEISFTLDLVSPTNAWVDGIILTLPAGVEVISAPSFEAGGGTVDPEIVGNVINMGLINNELTENGVFHGGEEFAIVVRTTALPINIDYVIKDDGWESGGNPMDATGTATLTELGYAMVTQSHWNVRDLNTGEVVVEDQTVLNGVDIYPPAGPDSPGGSSGVLGTSAGADADPIFHGIKVSVNGSYAAPITIDHLELNGNPLPLGNGGRTPYDLTDYTFFGIVPATAFNKEGYGTQSIDDLQQDYEIRWTGTVGDTVIDGQTVEITTSGGSYATFYGARLYDWANHPLNPTNTQDRFLVRVPFEVWNKDQNIQIDYQIYDRNQADPTANGFKVWNTGGRMYTEAINAPYTGAVVPAGSPNATWNHVWYNSMFTNGDVVSIYYANPLQLGVDNFTFTTPAPTFSVADAQNDVNAINVFPNPYYGVNSEELNKYNRFVTFTHLPAQAKIRIFNLAGVLVRTIDKDDTGQFQRWDLANESGLPVASGLYIAYIDMPELGSTKILKLAIIQEQQILDRF